MSTTFLSKKFLVKFISVVIAVVLVFGLVPVLDFADVTMEASAAEPPVYDPTLGSYTTSTDSNGNTILTATPNEASGFRGWFYKDGTEVSYNTAYTVPSGASASDYVPVFYNFNLVKKHSFEEYAAGTNMKKGLPEDEIWEGTCDGEYSGTGSDWTSMIVSNDRARTGSNSLKITSHNNTTYKDFYNLEPYTQYTLTFYYNIDPSIAATDTEPAVNNYLSTATIIGEDTAMTVRANSENSDYLAQKRFDVATGSCSSTSDWKKVKITFFTEANTTVRFLIYYLSKKSDGTQVGNKMYIDDVSLVKDVMAAPNYLNEDFTNSVKTWEVSDTKRLSTSLDGGRLMVTPILTSGNIISAPLQLKKGADYTITFDLDMSGVTDKYMPDEKDGVLLTDPSLVTEENPNGYVWKIHNQATGALAANWINLMLTTNESLKSAYYPAPANAADSTYNWLITDANGKEFVATYGKGGSSTGFGRYDSLKELDCSKPIKVKLTFTAHQTATVYFGSRLNGMGTYYLDNFVVTENDAGVDYADIVSKSAVVSKGTAIRTVGEQGMRYKTQIDKALLTADMPYGIRATEYGTIAIKSDYLNGKELLIDGEYEFGDCIYGAKTGVAYSFNDETNLIFAEDSTSLDFTGVLMNIPENRWNADYTARAYLKFIDKNGKTGIAYANPSDIAVYPVSKTAYSAKNANNEFVESESVRTYLYDNIISKFSDKIIKVSDDSTPISGNFQGIRSTIYHATTFFPDSHGRTYTEAQAAVEMDRLVDTKVDNVRTRFASQWMWKSGYGWDWESTKMTAYYKWADMLQDRDISITLQAGWHLHDFMYFYDKWVATEKQNYKEASSDGHSSIPEVNYLHGYNDAATAKVTNLYGEDAKAAQITAAGKSVGLTLTDEEYAHYSVAAARYAEWIRQGLNAFKAHGIYNVEYVLPFTETGYAYTDPNTKEPVTNYSYDEWILMVIALNDELEREGIRGDYKFIGPAQSIYAYQNRLSFIEYLYDKITGTDYEDLLDINAMHQYTSPNTGAGYEATVFEPYASYSLADENFNYYNDVLVNSGVRDMEFWCDEYFAHSPDAKWWNNVGMQMTQFAAGMTAGINNGVNRFLTWQMFDTLWDGDATHGDAVLTNSSEFSGGIHAVGTCPSLVHVDGKVCPKGENCPCTKNYNISSYMPRTTYYGINLIGKYMNNENADVFATEVIDNATQDGGGVYVSAIKNDNGRTVILVVNTMPTLSTVDIELERDDIVSFARYTYDPNSVVATVEAKSLPSDKSIELDGATSFRDAIPAQSFSIYVESGTFIGNDVEMPLEGLE